MKKVGIIGGSGFIGSYITKRFLEENYDVKVGVTDISKKDKYEHLMHLQNADHLEIFQLDVVNINVLKNFVQDCEILIHGGTPFQLDVKDAVKELLDPTIIGTENFLQAISESSALKKVVFIASVAAFNAAFPFPAESQSPDHVYTEADTPFIHGTNHPYAQAKHYADQSVRKFIIDNPNAQFEIVSVYPTFVVGKPLSGRQDSMSVGMQYLFMNKIAPNDFIDMMYKQDVEFAMVHVKDVADSIFNAAVIPGINGKNYLLSCESWKISDISLMLNKQPVAGSSRTVYSSKLATQDLGINFKPAQVPLNEYA
ncbi:MAG: dihydroflavonol 4-reductase [Daejeonella sp.]|nr:dihydroflavonol 4-reductase [Daejeonella sp.]